MTKTRSVLWAALAAAIAVSVSKLVEYGGVGTLFGRQVMTSAEVERIVIEGTGGAYLSLIRDNALADYDVLIGRLTEVANSAKSKDEVRRRAFDLTSQYRQSLALHAGAAPEAMVREALDAHVAIARAIRADVTKCNEFWTVGGAALVDGGFEGFVEAADRAALANILALLAARDAGTAPRVASDADRAEVFSQWAEGVSPEDVDAVATPDADNPRLCEAMILLFEDLTALDTPAAGRIRASLFHELVSS